MEDFERQVLVACTTLKNEIEQVSAELGIWRRTIWLESQLHDEPNRLAQKLQEALDSINDADYVLLGYGNCGNVVQGLAAQDFTLVIPRLDDCISLLFGSQHLRSEYGDANRSIYLTDGWMSTEHNIVSIFEKYVAKYGREQAEDIYDMMYRHYETMTFLDTGLYDVEALKQRTCAICDMLGLCQKTAPATLDYVRALIAGSWDDERFVCVAPGETVPAAAFMDPY